MGGSCLPKPRSNKHDRVVAGPVVQRENRMSAFRSVLPPTDAIVVRRATSRPGDCNQHRPVFMQSRELWYIGSPDPGGTTPSQQMRELVSTQSRGSSCIGSPDPSSLEVEMPYQPSMSSAPQQPLELVRNRLGGKHLMAPRRSWEGKMTHQL